MKSLSISQVFVSRRNEELFSSSSLARTNDTDFAGSRMLLKSEDSSNELLFLDARLSNAAINIIGQIECNRGCTFGCVCRNNGSDELI